MIRSFQNLKAMRAGTKSFVPVSLLLGVAMGWGLWALEIPALAQEAAPDTPAAQPGNDFEKQSLALRTALHYDPSLESPLKTLVTLYRDADRSDELIGLYRGHVAQYPDDAGAKAVLIRLCQALNRPEADELAQSAAQLHPDHPLLNYLLYELRSRRDDPRALESLAKAISLETKVARRDGWAEILLEESGDGAGRELAQAHLEKLRTAEGNTAESLVGLAERMHRHQFDELAFATLQDAGKLEPDPETTVELEILAAKVQAALGDRSAAGSRLDALLEKQAPDYWRRAEIMSLRVGLLSSEEERRQLLAHAKSRYEANAGSESAILEYAELLAVSELRREAVEVLQQGSADLPASERIEKQLLSLLERLNDQKTLRDYLGTRVEAFPDRPELRYRLVKVLHPLGERALANEELEKVLAQLEPEEADRRMVDLARFLRRSNLFEAAVEIFERIIVSRPDRFDVIRELAETHLALEDRGAARSTLRDLPVKKAEIENFLDLVQFMVAEDFLPEARRALETRMEAEPDSLDLQLPLATVLAKTGDRVAAETLFLKARLLTDTPARYRLWLQTAMEAHELFGDVALFFDAEQERLVAEAEIEPDDGWSADRIERFLTYCELGEEKRLEDRVTLALRNQLADPSLPGELRLRLRRLLVKALERAPDRAGEAEQQLQLLAKEDPGRASEYDLRRALMYHSLQRTDLAGEALEKVDVNTVADPKLLKAAYLVFIEYRMPEAARRCLEQVTAREPGDFVSWEKRLSLLAAMGEEEELRKAIRQLLAESDRAGLGERSVQALRLHLLDSLWRSVSHLLGTEQGEGMAAVLPLLDSVDREAQNESDRLWSLWARAFVFNGLGQIDARTGAVRELSSVALQGGKNAEDVRIAFPDGLSISLLAALELLREPFEKGGEVGELVATEGPLGASRVAWAFEVEPGNHIVGIRPVSGDSADLLILDNEGTCYRVNGATGKLAWRERFLDIEESSSGIAGGGGGSRSGGGSLTISNSYYRIQQQGGTLTVHQLMAPYQSTTLGGVGTPGAAATMDLRAVELPRQLETDGEGRFFMPVGRRLEARSIDDGALLWTSELLGGDSPNDPAQTPGIATPGMQIVTAPGRVIAYLPGESLVAGLDGRSGKLIWVRQIPIGDRSDQAGLFALNSGITGSGDRVFVYGQESVVIDTNEGNVLWRFDSGEVRTFPISLVEAEADLGEPTSGETTDSSMAPAGTNSTRPGFLDHLTPAEERADAVRRFLQYEGALVAPAVHWSAARLSQAGAASAAIAPGDRLLLFGEGGLRNISLRLPLASRFHPAGGVFVGVSGRQAWFLAGDNLVRLDLVDGTRTISSLAAVTGNTEVTRAVLSGGRVYVIGEKGIRVVNAWDGEVIANWGWPESVEAYRSRIVVPKSGRGAKDRSLPVWQGEIRKGLSAFPYCLPFRDLVAGNTLYALVGDGAVVALREVEPVPDSSPVEAAE